MARASAYARKAPPELATRRIGRDVAMHSTCTSPGVSHVPAVLRICNAQANHVLRCCAAAVRAAPRQYRARSVFLLGFAILLRAFAMFLNSSRRDCHVFAVLCGAFGVALSIPCGSTLARTCRSCACRVVHRDLEPANILAMLDQVGTTVLHVTNFSKARDLPRRGRRRLHAKAFVDHANIKPNTRVQGWTPGVCTLFTAPRSCYGAKIVTSESKKSLNFSVGHARTEWLVAALHIDGNKTRHRRVPGYSATARAKTQQSCVGNVHAQRVASATTRRSET